MARKMYEVWVDETLHKSHAKENAAEPRYLIAAMAGLLIALSLAFFLMFFNRFSALRSGNGEYASGATFLQGIMPYRDYFTAGPPMNMLKSALLLKLFGIKLIVSRTAGVMERLVIALVLFLLAATGSSAPEHALLATVTTIIVSAGDRTDPIASYNHDAILFAMAAGLVASFVLQRRQSWKKLILLAGLSGVFAGLSLLTKQTVGLGVIVAVLTAVAILLLKIDGWQRALGWCVAYTAGCSVPLMALAIYLRHMGLLQTFLQMLFVQGPSAKASHPNDFLIRDLVIAWGNGRWIVLGCFALALGWRAMRRTGWNASPITKQEELSPAVQRLVRIGTLGLVIILTAALLAYTRLPVLHDFSKSAVYCTFIGITLLLWIYLGGVLKPISRRQAQCILICAVSWSVAFMLSLSWPAFEAMLLPGLGFVLAAMPDGVRPQRRWAVYCTMAIMVFMQVREKLDLPFGFDYQNEPPVREAVVQSNQEQRACNAAATADREAFRRGSSDDSEQYQRQ